MKIAQKKINYRIAVLLALLILVACEKDTDYKGLTGQIIGKMYLYDVNGGPVIDKSGVNIILEGSNPHIATISDENGDFIIKDIKSGTYNIIFEKIGYCTNKIIGGQIIGGNKPIALHSALYEKTNNKIDSLKIYDIDNFREVELLITGILSDTEERSSRSSRYFLSNSPEISYMNYVSSGFTYNNMRSGLGYNMSFRLIIDTVKFPIGSELYILAFPAIESYQSFIDINTGKIIFTSINIDKPSNIASFIVPNPKINNYQ